MNGVEARFSAAARAGQGYKSCASLAPMQRIMGGMEHTSAKREGQNNSSSNHVAAAAPAGAFSGKEKLAPALTKPSSRAVHASSSGTGIRVPTNNPLVKKKMQLVEKWKRNQEREDEEERRLEEERERREAQRQLRERMKLEQWKERQIASGKAASNANLIEVKEDWRSIVEVNRSQQQL